MINPLVIVARIRMRSLKRAKYRESKTKKSPRTILSEEASMLRLKRITSWATSIDEKRRGRRIHHLMCERYRIDTKRVLAMAMTWINVTAVEKGKREGKKIMAIMGKPNPIFAWRKEPTNTIRTTKNNNTSSLPK